MNGNSSTSPQEMSEALARGEQFTRIFVQPMVEAVRIEMQTHQEKLDASLSNIANMVGGFGARLDGDEQRIVKLEKDQRKALLGWSAYSTLAAAIFAYGYNWIKSHIKLG